MSARDQLIVFDLCFLAGIFLVLWSALLLRRMVRRWRERREWERRLSRVAEQSRHASGAPVK